MAKFLILMNSSDNASELMANATPEQMQAAMQEWIDWKDNLDPSISFEWGMPLQIAANVTPTSITDGKSAVSGYAIMQGDKDAICQILQTHPHLKRDGSSFDLLQMMSMPGQ